MRVLVTGSSGHFGEALVRTLRELEHEVVGLDILSSPFTTCVGSVTDRSSLAKCMIGVQVVFHVATLHKPHVDTHSRQSKGRGLSRILGQETVKIVEADINSRHLAEILKTFLLEYQFSRVG